MKLVRQFLLHELHHYQKLSTESRKVLQSIFLFTIAAPVLSTFTSAFLWRTSQNVELVIFYNLATYIGIPTGFYINGEILKKYSPTNLYFWGTLTQGVVVATLLFVPTVDTALIMLFGFLFGITSGFYWSNRSLLTLHTTKSHQRIYFSSVASISAVLFGIVVPLSTGWFIVFGEKTNTYTATAAYQVLGIMLLFLLYRAGATIKKIPMEKPIMQYTSLKRPSKRWKQVRLLIYLLGITNSIEIIFPTLLVLMFVGNEGKLGTIQSISGIFLAMSLYHIAKKIDKDYRFFVFIAGVLFSIIAAFMFSMYYSAFGVICYFILSAFAGSFRWTIISPVTFDVMDGEVRRYAKNRYAYIFDQELFLNLGRNTSLIVFLMLYAIHPDFIVRFGPLLFALPQLGLIWMVAYLEKTLTIDFIREKALLYNFVKTMHNQNDY